VYLAFFVPEKDPELVRILEEEKESKRVEKRQKRKEGEMSPDSPRIDSDEDEEPVPDISQTFAILRDVI